MHNCTSTMAGKVSEKNQNHREDMYFLPLFSLFYTILYWYIYNFLVAWVGTDIWQLGIDPAGYPASGNIQHCPVSHAGL